MWRTHVCWCQPVCIGEAIGFDDLQQRNELKKGNQQKFSDADRTKKLDAKKAAGIKDLAVDVDPGCGSMWTRVVGRCGPGLWVDVDPGRGVDVSGSWGRCGPRSWVGVDPGRGSMWTRDPVVGRCGP